jgi:uncharacterized repeat protein (TIGR03803 family)
MKQKILALAFALTLAINLSAVGGNFTTLHSFLGYPNDGFTPEAGLFLSGSNLYGTTRQGGKAGYGMVFKTDTIGSGFTNLYSFTSVSAPYPYTNNDGAVPYARLLLSGNALFGTAQWGGNSGNGTVFAVSADGTGFTNLHSFTVMPTQLGHWPETNWFLYTNSDGADPFAGMIISGDTLYGTTAVGGNFGNGGIFAIKTDGSDFTNLYSFTAVFGSMARRLMVAVRVMARCSPSTLTARALQICIASSIAMEQTHLPVWLCRAVRCMEQHFLEAVTAMARYLKSTLLVRILRTCTPSRQPLALLIPTPTERILTPA